MTHGTRLLMNFVGECLMKCGKCWWQQYHQEKSRDLQIHIRVINTLNTKFSWQSLGGEGMSTMVGNDVDKNL